MSRFHTLTVKKIHRETADCVSVVLDVPESLRDTFQYKQGQYLTFKIMEGGEEIRRSYSLCSCPHEGNWKVAIKKVPEGRFSAFAHSQLKEGAQLEVMPPNGRFYTELNPQHQKNYLFFAAGSGITPVLSIIKSVLHVEPLSKVTLIYGNKGRNSIIFKEEIEGLKNRYVQRLSVHHILSREHGDADLLFGRIDKDKTKLILEKIIAPDTIDECFICGPEEMINAVNETLQESNVDKQKIHFELFTSSNAGQRKQRTAAMDGDNRDKMSKVTIRMDGSVRQFEMSYYGDTLLDAAMENGTELPYSCKNGMCCTCRAKLTKGQVEMDVNYSLEPDEVAAGYILTCQARPLSEEIEVDFDTV